MMRSYFFRRDPADSYYTDCYEPPIDTTDWSNIYCPFCDGELTGQPDGKALCDYCGCTFDDEQDVINCRQSVNAGATPYYSANGEL